MVVAGAGGREVVVLAGVLGTVASVAAVESVAAGSGTAVVDVGDASPSLLHPATPTTSAADESFKNWRRFQSFVMTGPLV
jgi:hypothetical protein